MSKRRCHPPRKAARQGGWNTALRETALLLLALPLAAFTAVLLWDGAGPDAEAAPEFQNAGTRAVAADGERLHFAACGFGSRANCVVDGDTIWLAGTKVRMADYNTPETSNPGCAAEARLGAEATARLTELLNSGEVEVRPNPEGRDTDRYGRALQVVTVDGVSVGDTLVAEGLAEEWQGYRREWC